MTVSGCVAAGKDAGQYMLSHAMAMGGLMEKDKMKSSDHMMSYDLVGGDLKAHMGHKVEVMGTMSKMDMDHRAKMDAMDNARRTKAPTRASAEVASRRGAFAAAALAVGAFRLSRTTTEIPRRLEVRLGFLATL